MKLKSFALAIFTVCIAISAPKAAEAATFSVIADGLDNARGVSVGPDGSVYVTETGVGGDGGCVQSPSVQYENICSGNTAAITRIKDGKQERIVTGLSSLALEDSKAEGAGPQDIKFDSQGNAYLVYGYAGNPEYRDTVFEDATFGKLYKIDLGTGELTTIADLAGYELANNPDGGDVISNPYALEIKGDTAYVVDAGANDVFTVALDGSGIQSVTPVSSRSYENAEFPDGSTSDINLQAVPTGVAIGDDGTVYISDFSGYPYPEGGSRVYKIGKDGELEVYADGFTQIADLAFDQNGNLLVLQYADESQWKGDLEGSLIQVSTDGTRTTLISAGEGLESATSLDVAADGTIYITNKGDRPGAGQVLKYNGKEVPEPSSIIGLITASALGTTVKLKRKRAKELAKAEIA